MGKAIAVGLVFLALVVLFRMFSLKVRRALGFAKGPPPTVTVLTRRPWHGRIDWAWALVIALGLLMLFLAMGG